MHTVKRAAELTGIAPETLRIWERRYAVVAPPRSGGGYRLYDDRSIRRLAAMKELVDAGWSAAQAARRVLDDAAAVDVAPAAAAGSVLGDVTALTRIARDFDAAALDAALDEAFALGTFEQVVDSWLMPSLARLGEAWRGGSVSVAGEHFVSGSVQRRLAACYDAAGRGLNGPTVVVGLAQGARHELGILAFGAAVRRAGLRALYVGADLPPTEWAVTVRTRSAAAVVLGVPTADDVPSVRETLDALTGTHPGLPVFLGGGHQDAVGGAARVLGHEVGAAARRLADLLASSAPAPAQP